MKKKTDNLVVLQLQWINGFQLSGSAAANTTTVDRRPDLLRLEEEASALSHLAVPDL